MSSLGSDLLKGADHETEVDATGISVLGCGGLTLLALVLVANEYGNEPTVSGMELAAGLGAAIGGALTLM